MAHSIELLFDDDTDTALRRVWDELTEAGVPSQGRVMSPTNRPHVTLLVFGPPPKPTNGRESSSSSGYFVDLGEPESRGRFTLAHLNRAVCGATRAAPPDSSDLCAAPDSRAGAAQCPGQPDGPRNTRAAFHRPSALGRR